MPIVLEKLTHTYMPGSAMQSTAVNSVTFTIEDGEFFGVIGHTGSGKSTLVQHINGLLQPTGGSVTVNGINLADKKTRREVRKTVGMMFQYPEYQLFEETVAKDVAFAPRNLGFPEDEIEGRVERAMNRVGLPYGEFRDRSPFELSGGQKRRAAMAGILAVEPSALILDEPMAGLDPAGREDMLSLVERLNADGVTIVMVSHSMDDIARMCDRVAVMSDGSLFMLGTPAEVFSRSEELMEIGLDVPSAAKLAALLRARGLDVPKGIFMPDELSKYLTDRWRNA